MAPKSIVEADLTLLKRQLPGAGMRGARRYRCDFVTLCRIIASQSESSDIAWVHDVSSTGVGLVYSQTLSVGATITLRLRKSDQSGVILIGAEVIHCTPEVNGSWRIGCRFERALTDDELDSCL